MAQAIRDLKNIGPKVNHHTRSKWFIHGTKHRKENQLLSQNPLIIYPLQHLLIQHDTSLDTHNGPYSVISITANKHPCRTPIAMVARAAGIGSPEIWVVSFYSRVCFTYRQVSNIRRTLVGNKIVGHSDAVGASPVGAAPTTSSFST